MWTGVEYFRSELYYLKFSWFNLGYALPALSKGVGPFHLGMYGCGFLIFGVITAALFYRRAILWCVTKKLALAEIIAILILVVILVALVLPALAETKVKAWTRVSLVGIQMEFPPEHIIPKMLDRALAKYTNAPIFVLSEYTLNGPVPDALKTWCRDHARYLVVGGEDSAGASNYYDTAFVVGTNGDLVFKQGKSIPIQFFRDGLPAPGQGIWNSPWGKIGFCVCYDLSYARVTDELVRQGAQLLIVPTMDVEYWSPRTRVAHPRRPGPRGGIRHPHLPTRQFRHLPSGFLGWQGRRPSSHARQRRSYSRESPTALTRFAASGPVSCAALHHFYGLHHPRTAVSHLERQSANATIRASSSRPGSLGRADCCEAINPALGHGMA